MKKKNEANAHTKKYLYKHKWQYTWCSQLKTNSMIKKKEEEEEIYENEKERKGGKALLDTRSLVTKRRFYWYIPERSRERERRRKGHEYRYTKEEKDKQKDKRTRVYM